MRRKVVVRRVKKLRPVTIGDQVFVGDEYDPGRFEEIKNKKYISEYSVHKPIGGLWTSSLKSGRKFGHSEWTEFVGDAGPSSPLWSRSRCANIIKPKPGARVFEVEDKDAPIDFEGARRKGIDALYFPRHLGYPISGENWFSYYDVESTLWLSPAFDVVRKCTLDKKGRRVVERLDKKGRRVVEQSDSGSLLIDFRDDAQKKRDFMDRERRAKEKTQKDRIRREEWNREYMRRIDAARRDGTLGKPISIPFMGDKYPTIIKQMERDGWSRQMKAKVRKRKSTMLDRAVRMVRR